MYFWEIFDVSDDREYDLLVSFIELKFKPYSLNIPIYD